MTNGRGDDGRMTNVQRLPEIIPLELGQRRCLTCMTPFTPWDACDHICLTCQVSATDEAPSLIVGTTISARRDCPEG